MSEQTATVTIAHVSSKEGATNGKPWRKWSVKDEGGNFYSTFDAGLGAQAEAHTGERAEILWKPSGDQGQFKDLLAVKPLNGAAPVSDRKPEGTADWDLIGLRKTRCLLWAHFLGSPAAKTIVELTTEGSKAEAVYRVGQRLIALAESDIYHRDPAVKDEDIPF